MRRNAVFKSSEQETEFLICLLFGEADDLKHLFLDVALVYTDTAAAELDAVENDVIGLCPDTAGIGINAVPVLFHRHGEGMMHRHKTVFFL